MAVKNSLSDDATKTQISALIDSGTNDAVKKVQEQLENTLVQAVREKVSADQNLNASQLIEKIALPQGAVLPFSRENCPEGWEEYKAAYGRFIRGLDRSGESIDSQGLRVAGSLQGDSTRLPTNIQVSPSGAHAHIIDQIRRGFIAGNQRADGQEWSTAGMYNGAAAVTNESGAHTHTLTGGDAETRPKNVALLYCIKK